MKSETAPAGLNLRGLIPALVLAAAGAAVQTLSPAYHYISLFCAAGVLFSLLVWLSGRLPARGGKILRNFLKWALIVCVVGFLLVEDALISCARMEDDTCPEAVIVLGCLVTESGASPVLQDRLETAADYLQDHPGTVCVVCGGKGANEPVSEASVMAQWLRQAGIEEETILLEDRSQDTAENIINAYAVLKNAGYDTDGMKVALVTSDYHICRAKMLAERQGFSVIPVPAAVSSPGQEISGYLRESLGIIKSILFD